MMRYACARRALFCLVAAWSAVGISYGDADETARGIAVRGTVFLDNNGNGMREEDETGMPNVQVSDGEEIQVSDEQGRYHIQTTSEIPNTVFVINPNGYLPTGTFYHVVTAGSDDFDFGLQRDPQASADSFSFYHGADFQFDGPRNHAAQIRADFDAMEAWGEERAARFYTFVGDITGQGTLEDLRFYRDLFSALQRPVHTLFGGHDGLVEMERPRMGNFVDVFGPYAYAWNYGGVHFIALVSEGYLSEIERSRQMRWWWRDMELLDPGTPIIILAHTPDPLNEDLRRAAEDFNIIAFLFGHWHTHHNYEVDGIPFFTSSPMRPLDWGAFTKRARLFRYANGALTSHARVLEQKKRLVVLRPDSWVGPGALDIRACAYDTSVVPDKVDVTVATDSGDATWKLSLEARDEWTWGGTLDEKLPPGKYTITAQVDNDPEWIATKPFSISSARREITLANDWPSLFGDAGTRASDANLAPPFRLKWLVSLGSPQAHRSSPIIVEGRVYQGVMDGQAGFRNAGVICIDGRNGEILWKTPLPRDINATVCSDGALVFAVDCQGGVYGLDLDDGAVRWRGDAYEGTDFHEQQRYSWRTFLAPVTVHNGVVFVAGSRVLAGFSAENGEKLWTNYNDLNQVPYPVSGMAPMADQVYFEDEHKTVALAQKSGEVIWAKPLKGLSGNTARERGATTPLATTEGAYFHHRNHLRKLHPQTGDEIWTAQTPSGFNYVGGPAFARGKVVVSAANAILAFDSKTGERLWTCTTLSGKDAGLGDHQKMLNGSAPLIVKDHVLVGSDDGRFYALRLKDGAKVWEFNTGTPIKASSALSGNLVVVSNFAGNVMGFVPE
jgi:outer membrane protein assembly factor BamB